jgi:hypothetical protein
MHQRLGLLPSGGRLGRTKTVFFRPMLHFGSLHRFPINYNLFPVSRNKEPSMSQPIKLESLRELVAAGSVKSATILGQKGGYAVLASVGLQQRPLGTKYGEVRTFASTDTAVKALREVGLSQFNLDVTHYEQGRLRAARPDVTHKAQQARAALTHDRWFREQVQSALDSDARGEMTWHDHDTLWADLEADAAKLVAASDAKSRPTKRRTPTARHR